MNNFEEGDYLHALTAFLDRPIAFHRGLRSVVDGAAPALMLSQAIYWTRRTDDGWFYKTQADWEEETLLTRREQETARKNLRLNQFWSEERRGIPAKLYFRVDLLLLVKALAMAQTPEKSSMAENANLECTKPPFKEGVFRQPILYTENTYKELDKDVEQNDEFLDFVNFWNSEKNPLWSACEKLNPQRIGLLKRLIKDEGTSALEIFQKAVKFARQDKFWCTKRMTIDNILRHCRELSEKYLETPNGHVISDSDLSMAARMKETQELAERLAKKFNYNGVNNNA
jgi:hypothetical protein